MKFHHKTFLEQLKERLNKEIKVLNQSLLWNQTQIKIINEIIEEQEES